MGKKTKISDAHDGFATAYTVKIPLWPYLVAPLACAGALLFAGLINHFYTRDPAMAGWAGFTLGILGLLLIAFTAIASRPRGLVMQLMALANCVLGLGWMAPAIIEGPWSLGMLGAWAAGTAFVSLTAAIYRIMRQTRGNTPLDGVLNGEFAEVGDAVKQLKNVRFSPPRVEGAAAAASVTMPAGRTFKEIEQARAEVASLLDVSATAVRTIPDPDSERRGALRIVPVDQLRSAIPDPGLPRAGRSIAEPIVLGVAEDGTDAALILPGDPAVHRNAVGMFGVVGMSGSGKTEALLRFCKEVATRHDGELTIADARKAGQLPGWVKRAAVAVVDGREPVLSLLEDLEGRVASRAKRLGAAGHKQWVEDCGIPFETYVIFEASAVVMDSNIVDIAESVRSVGMCVVLELQRATFDRLPTSARSNITTWLVLGVEREGDAEAALSEETLEAGAAPWKWKNTRPGYFYLEWAGRPRESWSAPCRSYIQDDADRAADVAAALGWNDKPTTGAAETAYRGRPEVHPEPVVDGEQDMGDGVDPDDPPDDCDPSTSFAPPPGTPVLTFGAQRKMPTAQAVDLLKSHLFDMTCAGLEYVRPAELSDVLAQTGLSAGWLHGALADLTKGEDRVLHKAQRGVYRLVTPARV